MNKRQVRWSWMLAIIQPTIAFGLLQWAARQQEEMLRHVLAIWDWIPPAKQAAHVISYPVLPVVYFSGPRPVGLFYLPDSPTRLAVYLISAALLWFWLGRMLDQPKSIPASRGWVRIMAEWLGLLYGLFLLFVSRGPLFGGQPSGLLLLGAGLLWSAFFVWYFSKRMMRG